MKPLLLQGAPQVATPPPPSAYLRWGTRYLENDWSKVTALKPGLLIRRMVAWSSVQPTAGGAYDWSSTDSWIPSAAAAGIKIMGVLSKAPTWATGGAGAGNKYPAGNQNAFYSLCAAAAAHYPQVDYWEIMNEPDNTSASGTWTSAQVAEILIGAANAIVAARSTAKVIGICTMMSFSRKQSFVNPILNAIRGVSTIYGVSMHAYTRPNAPELATGGSMVTQVATAISMMDAAGFTGPLFITEFGDPTTFAGARSPGWVSEADAANWLVRQSIIHASFPRVERSVQFQLPGSSTTTEEGGMGLIRGANDRGGPGETSAGPAGSFKPGYHSLKNMMGILDETAISIIAQSTGPLYKYRYEKTGGVYGFIIWCVSGEISTVLTGLTSSVKVTQNNGSSATVATTDGALTISATPSPQYIEPISAPSITLSDPLATVEAKALWSYLNGLKSKTSNKVLSGQRWMDYNTRVQAATGKWCAILNIGVNNTQDGVFDNFAADASARQNDMLNWWNAGGIVVFDLFLRSPVSKGPLTANGTVPIITQAQMISARTAGTTENANVRFMLDRYVAMLLWLQARNVPVIVRHMIEHNGSGFWYLDNPDLINFYRYCRTYIINAGVHNALWTHCPSHWGGSGNQGPASDPSQYMVFYPGDDVIDIMGFDLYQALENRAFTAADFAVYTKVHGDRPNKPVMCFEMGVKTDYYSTTKVDMRKIINGIRSYAPDCVGFFCWSVTWSLDPMYNNNTAELLADPWVITRDEVVI